VSNDGGPFVIDASAVLALLFAEPGAEVVNKCIAAGTIGVVNLAETLAKLVDRGLPVSEAARAVSLLALNVAPMTETQAETSAAMRPISRLAGLSLGDRACLALAMDLGRPALTADRNWATIGAALGVPITLIRGTSA
jgi:PIN domain nuclease of toxin-antitoxin system